MFILHTEDRTRENANMYVSNTHTFKLIATNTRIQ